MTRIKNKIEETIKAALKDLNIEARDFAVEHPENISFGDYSTNVAMTLSKSLGKNSFDLASEIAGDISANLPDFIEKVEALRPGFINFHLSSNFLLQSVGNVLEEGEKFGQVNIFEGKKVVVEHTQPNPFKEFHIGHLMNNAIGESIVRLMRNANADVKAVSYHGDVGLHVAKAVWDMKNRELYMIGKEYVVGDIQSTARSYVKGSEMYDSSQVFRNEINKLNQEIYTGTISPEVKRLYEMGRKISLDEFEKLYERLGSRFDEHFFESETGNIGAEIVRKYTPSIFKESEGAFIFKGEEFIPKTHTRVFINSGGVPTYEAKEIGLAKIKMDRFAPYEMSVTVTANEQDSFFDVVEVAIGEVFSELKGKLKHLSHGILKLPSGKMSSRTGDVITAENLIEKIKNRVSEKISDRGFDENEKQSIAETVAIGAIKYSILRQSVGGDIVFDFDKSISFDGDSGPYLQYTAVRAKSVLEKAAQIDPNYNTQKMSKVPFDTVVGNSEKLLYRFPEVVERAAKDLSPHHIVTYLTEVAGSFNTYYAHNQIIDAENPEITKYRLALTKAVQITLTNGLHLLGIKVPERM